MDFEWKITAVVERIQGKFASREEIEEAIQAALIGGLGADGESEYEITDYNVEVSA